MPLHPNTILIVSYLPANPHKSMYPLQQYKNWSLSQLKPGSCTASIGDVHSSRISILAEKYTFKIPVTYPPLTVSDIESSSAKRLSNIQIDGELCMHGKDKKYVFIV
jgi:hypothetical protein